MKHKWVWRFLVTWYFQRPHLLAIGFYPDFEHKWFGFSYDAHLDRKFRVNGRLP